MSGRYEKKPMSPIFVITAAVLFVLLYIVALPILMLFHELGHAIVALSYTSDTVIVTLAEGARWERTIGRLTIAASSLVGSAGFCYFEGQMTRRQYAVFSLAGPVASLLVCLITGIVLIHAGDWAAFVLWGVAFSTATQFLGTIIPVRYPSWLGNSYAGLASDGYCVVQILRE